MSDDPVFLGKIIDEDDRDCNIKEATPMLKTPRLLEILGSLTEVTTGTGKSGSPLGVLSLLSKRII